MIINPDKLTALIKVLDSEPGVSFDPLTGELRDFTGRPMDIITLASCNFDRSELTPENVANFLAIFGAVFGTSYIPSCAGMFVLPDGRVSVDVNVVVHQSFRANSMHFCKWNNQVALWDCRLSAPVATGGSGDTKLTIPDVVCAVATCLVDGKLPEPVVPTWNTFRWVAFVELESFTPKLQYVGPGAHIYGSCAYCLAATAFGDCKWTVGSKSGRLPNMRMARQQVEEEVAAQLAIQ